MESLKLSAKDSEVERAHSSDKVSKKYKIPVEVNDQVRYWINYFTVRDRARFQRFLNRGQGYRDVVEGMLEENELPAELYYLAMIESGFSTHAYSHAHAVGVWQFITGTGTRYGLRVDRFVDERRDPIRSTEAAAKYLKDLYNAFGSWYLAMAAYNAGEMRVMRAVFKTNSRDFWTLVREGALPAETSQYVPKFLAVVLIGQNPEKYGFTVRDNNPFPDAEIFAAPGSLGLKEVARISGVPYHTLLRLNPNLKFKKTPPGGSYEIWVPMGKAASFRGLRSQFLAAAGKGSWSGSREVASTSDGISSSPIYKVKRGDTLGKIARAHKISTRHLAEMNNLKSQRVFAGMQLRIQPSAYKTSSVVRYKVRRGDNLIKIASKFGVTVAKIRSQNRIKRNYVIVGEILKIRPAAM